MQLNKQTIRGVGWAYGAFLGGKLFTFITTAILARLLLPEEFGVLGYALLLLGIFDAVQDFGINDALIYNTERQEETAHTAFWLNIFVGAAQFSIIYTLAPLALRLPHQPDPILVNVLRVFGLIFLINALGATHDSFLQKGLAFRNRYTLEFLSSVIKGVASIFLAVVLQSVWALVLGYLIGAAVKTITKWYAAPYVPRFEFYPDRAIALWNFGGYLVLINILTLFLDQADQAVIALFIGVTQLGFYTIAVKIPEMVIANFSLILTRVLYPVYTRLQDNTSRLVKTMLTTTQFTALFTVPAGFGIAAIAPELVFVVFGEKWFPAIGLLQVLALLGTGTTLAWSAGDAFKAIGRPKITAKLMFVEALYTLPMVFAAGIFTRQAFWASALNMVAVWITAVLRLIVTARHFNYSLKRYIPVFRAPFIGSIIMVTVIETIRYYFSNLPAIVIISPMWVIFYEEPTIPYVVTLIVSILVGGAIYAAVVWIIEREDLLIAGKTVLSAIRSKDSTV